MSSFWDHPLAVLPAGAKVNFGKSICCAAGSDSNSKRLLGSALSQYARLIHRVFQLQDTAIETSVDTAIQTSSTFQTYRPIMTLGIRRVSGKSVLSTSGMATVPLSNCLRRYWRWNLKSRTFRGLKDMRHPPHTSNSTEVSAREKKLFTQYRAYNN